MKNKLLLPLIIFGSLSLLSCQNSTSGVVGPQGEPGEQGEPGKDGEDGLSAYEIYLKYHPEYTGTEEEWINEFLKDKEYTVKFNTNSSDVIKDVITSDNKVNKPADPSLENYQFFGWKYHNEIFNFDTSIIYEDITLEAVYYHEAIDFTYLSNLNARLDFIDIFELADTNHNVDFAKCFIGLNLTDIGSLCTQIEMGYLQDENTLYNFILPNTVRKISKRAFFNIPILEKINLPESLEYLGSDAFRKCIELKEIDIPSKVKKINDSVFYECKNLKSVTTHEGLTSIGDYAFNYCSSLASFEIPSSVTYIGNKAFSACSSLKEIMIPTTVLEIGPNAFSVCSSLTIYVESEEPLKGWHKTWNGSRSVIYGYMGVHNVTTTGFEYALCSLNNDKFITIIDYNGNDEVLSVPDAIMIENTSYPVKNIAKSAFSSLKTLKEVTLPNTIVSIGEYAFSYCSSLININIPNSVKNIDANAFYSCKALKTITLPNSITSILENTFSYCSSLSAVIIPTSVTLIEGYAFSGCSSLENVYYSGSETEWNKINIDKMGNSSLTNATKTYNYNPSI